MTELHEGEGLYGTAPLAPAAVPPSLLDQLTGIFSEPVALFRRLHDAPVWKGAMALNFVVSLATTVLWCRKVDVDAMLRPVLERDPSMSAEQADKFVAMQARFIVPLGVAGLVTGMLIALTLFALVYWLIGKGTAEKAPPTYAQALAMTAVTTLVMVPHQLLVILMCFLKPVGGLTPDRIPPTSLGFFLSTEQVKLQTLLFKLDLFTLFTVVLIYLAARHTLRLKAVGAAACAGAAALIMIVIPAAFGR